MDKPKLVTDDSKSITGDDTGLYGSNATGQVTDIEGSDDEDFLGDSTNPDKVEESSTLDMAHKMGLYTEFSDEGEGKQGEVNAAEEFKELESEKDQTDEDEQ